MTESQFFEFVEEHELFYFDALIRVNLNDGTSHKAVWILGIPGLEVSADGRFGGTEHDNLLFYDFDAKAYAIWNCELIESLEFIQQEYLKPMPIKLKFNKG